jgi:hypothetical protein
MTTGSTSPFGFFLLNSSLKHPPQGLVERLRRRDPDDLFFPVSQVEVELSSVLDRG